MESERFSFPDPPPKPRGLQWLRVFGPGAILASATIGAGETVLAVRAGAWGGYDLLWLILLATLTKSFFLLYFIGRYAALTGEPVAKRLLHFPGPRGWLLIFILLADLIPAGPVFAAIAAPCGQLIVNIIGGDPRFFAIGFALLAIAVAVAQPYDFLEKQQVAVCVVLLFCVLFSTLLVGPNLSQLLLGLIRVGHVPQIPSWAATAFAGRPVALELATVFGYAGNIAMGYLVYADFVATKKWGVFRADQPPPPLEQFPLDETNVRKAKEGLRPLFYDLSMTAALIFFVTGAFLVAGAVVLNPIQTMPLGFDLLSRQAAIFERISPALVPVYYVAILIALWGTLNSLPEIYARVTRSLLTALSPRRFGRLSYRRLMQLLGAYFALTTVILIWLKIKPQTMIDFVGLYSTNLGVAAACLGALWLDRQLPKPLRASRLFFAAGLLSFLVIFTASAVSAAYQWFGP